MDRRCDIRKVDSQMLTVAAALAGDSPLLPGSSEMLYACSRVLAKCFSSTCSSSSDLVLSCSRALVSLTSSDRGLAREKARPESRFEPIRCTTWNIAGDVPQAED